MQYELMTKRDVLNFMTWCDAGPSDDYRVAQFLLATFSVTTALKRPELVATAERVQELSNVAGRRASGIIRVLEMGHRIVATYALMRPGSKECLSWTESAAYLRAVAIDPEFQGIKIIDAVMQDVLEIARVWEVPRICLHLVHGSDGLARLYQRYGYEYDARGNQFGRGFDLDGYQLSVGAKQETA